MTLLGSAESRLGRLRLGSHPSPDALLFGADGARTTVAVLIPVPGAPEIPCSPVSGFWSNHVTIYQYDGTLVGEFSGPPQGAGGVKIVGGSITQDIRATPYAQGRVEIAVEARSERTLYQVMVGLNLLQIVQKLRTWWNESGATLGRFEIQSAEGFFDEDSGEERVSFELVARASGSVGPTVEGDLTTIALPFASGLGLVAGGQASIEGIAAYLLSQYQGRSVLRGPGITPTVAFQTSVEDSGTTYYLGPYNISPPMGAAQIIQMALYQSGTYVVSDPSGAAILTGYPEDSAGGATAPPAWVFADDECAWPVRAVKPLPTEAPDVVTGINQSMLAEGSTESVSTQYGVGSGKVYYFNNFRPAGSDDGAFARRVRQLAYAHDQRARGVTLTVPSHPTMRAGDLAIVDLPTYGLASALYVIVAVTHPLGEDMNASVVLEAL